jgi:hypothetical protein
MDLRAVNDVAQLRASFEDDGENDGVVAGTKGDTHEAVERNDEGEHVV